MRKFIVILMCLGMLGSPLRATGIVIPPPLDEYKVTALVASVALVAVGVTGLYGNEQSRTLSSFGTSIAGCLFVNFVVVNW